MQLCIHQEKNEKLFYRFGENHSGKIASHRVAAQWVEIIFKVVSLFSENIWERDKYTLVYFWGEVWIEENGWWPGLMLLFLIGWMFPIWERKWRGLDARTFIWLCFWAYFYPHINEHAIKECMCLYYCHSRRLRKLACRAGHIFESL